jgi:hypothetical protein
MMIRRLAMIGIVICGTLAVVAEAPAQSGPSVPAQLQDLQFMVNGIDTKVTQVAQVVAPVALVTQALNSVTGTLAGCVVLNAGSTPADVFITLLNGDGVIQIQDHETIQPSSTSRNVIFVNVPDVFFRPWCRVTPASIGTTVNSLRAHLEIEDSDFRLLFVSEAH